jgi:tRNA pseudouridine13 synthase
VPGAPLRPPDAERALGLEFYASETTGVPGSMKATPEDFRVAEIASYPMPDPAGAFTILRVVSQDWEQHELGAALARELGLPPHAIAWSGTKDRRAVADRLASYRGPPPDGPVRLPRLEILEAYRARDGLVLGHHFGNSFDIRIRPNGASLDEALAGYDATERSLRDAGGVPNFFGPQRFGEVRPVTHLVGRALVQGDPNRAVDIYLTEIPEGSVPGRGDEARARYREHRDPTRALREMPPEYRFERTLLERLARGQDAAQALRGLSRELRLLFVHAYQSYLFNRWMSRRRSAGISMTRPVAGDRIARIGRDGTVRANDAVPVASDNQEECADLVARGRAMIAGPLVGYDTPQETTEIGRMIGDLLREEDVTAAGFRLPFAPEVSSKGAWRPVILPVPPIGRVAEGGGIRFRFSLPKGGYATVLLREFLKNGASAA